MVKGPNQQRLDAYVSGHNLAEIDHAKELWTRASKVLGELSTHLDNARQSVTDSMGGGKTGKAAAAAFHTVATSVKTQSADMSAAATALSSAHEALSSAMTTRGEFVDLGSRPADATHKTTDQGNPDAYHNRQLQAGKEQKTWDKGYGDQETASAAAVKKIDTHYTAAITTMEKIHGQTPTYGGGGGGGSTGPGGWTPPGGGTSPTATGGHHVKGPHTLPPHVVPLDPHLHHHEPHPPIIDPVHHDHGYPPVIDPTHHQGHNQDGPTDHGWPNDHPGSPQGPGSGIYPSTTGGTNIGLNSGLNSGLPPTTPAITGTVGGTMSGPSSTMVGGLMSGTMMGGATGLSGVLGRSAVTSAMTEEEILASRTTGAPGASGAAGSGTGLGARGAATGATGAGRGAGGTGAGGRGGKGKKKRKKGDIDFFEDNEDWLDEDEASPGVLH